jgi:hypothetical protein
MILCRDLLSGQLLANRLKAVEDYKKKHGRDPSDFLVAEDWMSDEISDKDTDDEETAKEYRSELAREANLSASDVEAGQVVWEVIRPAWRSAKVSNWHFLKCNR